MQLEFSTRYRKEYRKLPTKIKQQADERLRIFALHPFHPQLNNHILGGEYAGCRSINITGDYRAIFEIHGDVYVFIRIGTHPQLYG
ncbi:hypothetical protein A3A38_03435 [Candidatus Kaiserbacteria bacterium RIFCSPLOWO2_01_FULL_53_17]|uniref:Plasmid stabilization protein n=1 Tax=Candidatus Kaiserbacteria bacterium RIFCSPLOWO2_01_FULL_53_17 TaxID=1798511 RepID=A0A1F6EHN3_9BACT|nr:MAG: hypothetical protein A3A38_03435 [Candidatus Kaiserbacteria bacterium RIFCSPLOWO2_01_FULL_53_17]